MRQHQSKTWLLNRDLHGPGGSAGQNGPGRSGPGSQTDNVERAGPGFLIQRAGPGFICNMPERANLVNSKTFFSDNKLVQPTKLFLHSTNIPRNMVDLMHHTSEVVNTVSSRPLDCMREFEIQGEN